ncbi:hypothetical protein F3Y22_tig00110794pilonHSYRG00102 [Hibiscus syriacus]|uniref:Protein NIM1-INTERACTING 1-like n=1 Tax=Hibiscus syriacus TaxID=106335 RepID=A0A6A2ZQR9_HIBSY|nr:protein NIM1-INTERACTING 1-like [Hibiscus syriacus]KAE8693699.1 hypothetical protein F3Y22_tig00110794pilonHSYRG00102 [Hibiscus syriacus]
MATKERNRVSNGEGDREEQEDEKMEQFFALLRSFREARNKRKHELRQRDDEEDINKKKKNKTSKLGDDERSSWVPRFEWEDFTAEFEFRRPLVVVFPTPYNKKEDKKKQEEYDGLALNLTLSSDSV